MQHIQRTSPPLTINHSIVAQRLETDQPASVLGKTSKRKRAPRNNHFSPSEMVERGVIVLFTILLLSTTVRHLPMVMDFLTYLYLMSARVWDLITTLAR